MGLPASTDARRYYRVAKQRRADARFLLDARRLNAALYLGGYTVECFLKALIIQATPPTRLPETLKLLRGKDGHDLDMLRRRYLKGGGAGFPHSITRAFATVRSWGPDLRYEPKAPHVRDVEVFLRSIDEIAHWAEERI